MRMLKAALLAGASVGLMATAAQAQVPMPGFYFAGQGAYFWDSGPNDHREFPGFSAGSTGDGYKFQGVLGYRFDVPWDIGIGAGYGWLSKGKGEGPFNNKIKGEYWTVDGTIGYTDGNCAVFGDDSVAISSRVIDGVPGDAARSAGYPVMDARDLAISAIVPGRRSPAARWPNPYPAAVRGDLSNH